MKLSLMNLITEINTCTGEGTLLHRRVYNRALTDEEMEAIAENPYAEFSIPYTMITNTEMPRGFNLMQPEKLWGRMFWTSVIAVTAAIAIFLFGYGTVWDIGEVPFAWSLCR